MHDVWGEKSTKSSTKSSTRNMEARVSVVCCRWKVLSNGESPIMLKITQGGVRRMKSLGISVKVEHWDFDKNLPKKKCPNFTEVRHVITQAISKYQSKVLQNKIAGTTETLQSLLNEKEQLKKVTLDKFLCTLIEELRKQNKVGNSYAYLNLKTTIEKFLGEKTKIEFKDITFEFCSAFEKWMRNNEFADTTMHYYFRTLRATFNRAVADGIIPAENSPFCQFKLSKFSTKTTKRALSKRTIDRFVAYDCTQKTSIIQLAHSIFCFSYYCGGISFVDIANLTTENIIDDRLKYQRQKTHGDINLTLLPQAKKIIALFSVQEAQSGYLFPILNKNVHITAMQKHNRIRKLTRQINNALKEIGAELRIKENLTTYVARHTFATVLKKSGVNVGIISQALGHQDLKTTQIYLDSFDNEQIDEVMTKLL